MPHLSTLYHFLQARMKQWLDFIPLVAFLVINEKFGIFAATAVLVASSVLLYGFLWLREGKLENSQRITLIATLLFGGVTLALHDEAYIKWKAPVVYFVFALAFLGTQFFARQPLVQRFMQPILDMPDTYWRRLNLCWVLFFLFASGSNLYVAFHFDWWARFKVLGSMGMMLGFMIAQLIVLRRYLREEPGQPNTDERKETQ